MHIDEIPQDGSAGGAWPRPIPDSYWILPGKLCAGEYPGAKTAAETRIKLRHFLDAQINCFFDLTEAGELIEYAPILYAKAEARGQTVEHVRWPIRDLGIPTSSDLRGLLDAIDAKLAAGHRVYFHCWGGIGRTGTVAGCWLVRHGLTPDDALATIARLRRGTPDARRTSPETAAQVQMVRGWHTGE